MQVKRRHKSKYPHNLSQLLSTSLLTIVKRDPEVVAVALVVVVPVVLVLAVVVSVEGVIFPTVNHSVCNTTSKGANALGKKS